MEERQGKFPRYVEGKFCDHSCVPGLESKQSKLEPGGGLQKVIYLRKKLKQVYLMYLNTLVGKLYF